MKKIFEFFKEDKKLSEVSLYTGIVRFIPLILTGTFFAVTIFLSAFGPMDWHIQNPVKLYSFLLVALVALCGGYLLSTFKFKPVNKIMNVNISKIVIICSIIYIALFFPLCKSLTGSWYPNVYLGVSNTGVAYQIAKYYSEYGSKMVFYINILLSPFVFAIRPFTLFFWKRLSVVAKIFGVAVILLEISLGIAQGLNKQVADIVIQLVLILFIMIFANKKETKKQNAIHAIKLLSLILVICLTFVLYYGNSMRNRVSMDKIMFDNNIINEDIIDIKELEKLENQNNRVEEVDELITTNAKFNFATEKENTIWNIMPSKVKSIVNFLTSYFCHGYKGLSYAMEQEFTSSYGLGFSQFFRHNFCKLIGGEAFEKQVYSLTYMGKIDAFWPTGSNWSTFFIFPASDISFFGTILLVFLIGFLFGLAWKDAMSNGNPFALMSFFGFVTMTFYFSANNQMFQMGDTFIAFSFSIILWLITRIFWKKKCTT